MLDYIIPLISSYFSTNMFTYWFVPVICLCFVATVPYIIRAFIKWR